MRAAVVGLVLAVVVVAGAHPAAAGEQLDAAGLRALAVQARTDPVALQRLRDVDTVDGRPVDLRTALDVEGDELRARLQLLADGGPVSGRPADARAEAQRILAGRDFHSARTPRPLRGVLAWIGDRLYPLGAPFRWLRDASGKWVALVGAVVVVAAAVIAVLVVQRRALATSLDGSSRSRRGRREDPAGLEREADDAERRGDLEAALRLRFRAGLLRLDAAGALSYRPSLTTGEVRRQVPGPTLAGLMDVVDEVVYGRRPAVPGDVTAARQGWPRALAEASS